MLTLEGIISDRGSKYAVSGAPCRSGEEAKVLLTQLKRQKKFAKATHNSWCVICEDGPIKNDDGESGAGVIILRMLERQGLRDHLVVVTRWYGGKHLDGDRFRHVQACVETYFLGGWGEVKIASRLTMPNRGQTPSSARCPLV